jgi:hypothetical protein
VSPESATLTVTRPARAAATDRAPRRFARPPEWLWGACVAAQVFVAALLTSYTYFFSDDFMFMQQARIDPFGLWYLRAPLFEHFSPVTRVLDSVVVGVAPGSWALGHGIQLAIYAAAIASMAFVLRAILGRTWLALALSTLFGQSVFLLRLLNWFTATVNLMPATLFTLLAIGCYLHWTRARGRWWLVASLVAFAGALSDYETAMLFPAFLLSIRLLVMSDSLDPRVWVRELWSERWAWGSYAVLEVAALINYYTTYYTKQPQPTAGQVFHFLEISLIQVFVPGLLGIAHQFTPGTAAVVAGNLVFLVLVGVTLYLRPRAWRCLAAALLAFLLSMVPLALNRITTYGLYVGAELYYQQSAQFMFVVLCGFALSDRWGGRRRPLPARLVQLVRLPRVGARGVALASLAAAAAYGALYVTSVKSLSRSAWQPQVAHRYIDQFKSSVDRVKAGTGQEPNLIDITVPYGLMQSNFAPFNQYSYYFPVIDPHLRYDEASTPAFVVGATGALVRVHLAPLASGLLRDATLSQTTGDGVRRAAFSSGAACVPAGPVWRLRIPLSAAQRLGSGLTGLPYAIRVSYRAPVRTNVALHLSGPNGGLTLTSTEPHHWGPGAGTGLAIVRAAAVAQSVDVDLPGGSCVSALTVGQFAAG